MTTEETWYWYMQCISMIRGFLLCREFTRKVKLKKNSHGQIMVDSHLQVLGDPTGRVYALGDCVQVEGHTLPCTGSLPACLTTLVCGSQSSSSSDLSVSLFHSSGGRAAGQVPGQGPEPPTHSRASGTRAI